jgi:hypothetical protein
MPHRKAHINVALCVRLLHYMPIWNVPYASMRKAYCLCLYTIVYVFVYAAIS